MNKVSLRDVPEGGLRIHAWADEEELRPSGAEPLDLARAGIEGELTTALDDQYLFQGVVTGVYKALCGRCLDPIEVTVSADVTWVFQEGSDPDLVEPCDEDEDNMSLDDEGFFWFQGGELDLVPYVWEELVLAYPSRFLCSQECEGLCPGCGVNLNSGPCRCEPEAIKHNHEIGNKGFAGLAGMFPDIAPGDIEE